MKDEPTLPTSAEITRRLRTVSELRNLCLSLGRAGRVIAAADALMGNPPSDPPTDGRNDALRMKPD